MAQISSAPGRFEARRGALLRQTIGMILPGWLLFYVAPALAHEVPGGSEWVMADWMLLSFVSFFGAALVVFLIAVRRGLLRHLEEAKYYLLTVDEPDYYTPDWAKEDQRAPVRQR